MNRLEHNNILNAELAKRDAYWQEQIAQLNAEHEQKLTEQNNAFKSTVQFQVSETIAALVKQTVQDCINSGDLITKSELGEVIKKHLSINVDGYYEEYSGQREHYHKVEVQWHSPIDTDDIDI